MPDITFTEIFEMQNELLEKYKDVWSPLSPKNGRNSLLWMYEEMGEIAAIIKKRGDEAIVNDAAVRAAFIEECVDATIYMSKLLMSYGVTPEEFAESFRNKHAKNLKRDFITEHGEYLSDTSKK